jgi:zeaxanthin glucosyltransferase
MSEFRPDVVCADPAAYAPIIAAARAGVPWAGVSPLLTLVAPRELSFVMSRSIATVAGDIVARFARAGVDVALSHQEVISPWLSTVFAEEAFVPRAWSGNRATWFVGPVARRARPDVPSFPWDELDARRPLVYVSPGGGESLTFPDGTYERIAGAMAAREDAQGVFVMHGRIDGPLPACFPPNVIAVRRAPQLSLLARARVAVTHGGINTVTECLCAGCPMLVLPIGHEQPLQAELVRRAGVGLVLPLAASVAELADALRTLDEDPAFRARAAELARAYTERDGASVVAELLIRLGKERVALPTPPSTFTPSPR